MRLLLALLITFQLAAQSEYPMKESSLLWKIEGNGCETSYLFGTMHLIDKTSFYYPKKLEKTISKSDQLIMELGNLEGQMELFKYMTLKERTFFDFLVFR